jgi:hypothetical protein
MDILKTQNEGHGFAGTVYIHGVDVDAAWDAAFTAIAQATGVTGDDLDGVRGFLDARDGRHFADAVLDQLQRDGVDLDAAIADAVAQHMSWKIGARTALDHGIPRGLPYLTGWVLHYAILAQEV